MTDTITLTWTGTKFVSSAITSTGSSLHLIGTNMTVNWGDGTTGTITANQRFTHTYSSSGTYTITITGDSITSIGGYCFRDCNGLTSITIPPSITSLGINCFTGCTGLTSVTIPSNITSLGSYCFSGCTGLTSIIFTRPTPPTVSNSNTWTNIPSTCKIYVPNSSYKTANNYPNPSTYKYIIYTGNDRNVGKKSNDIVTELCNRIYPIGSIYISSDSTNPSELFGGTWAQIKSKFLLGCGDTYDNGTTGGSANAVTVSHSHSFTAGGDAVVMYADSGPVSSGFKGGGPNWADKNKTASSIASSGEDGIGKNMPPYLAVYIWQRIL